MKNKKENNNKIYPDPSKTTLTYSNKSTNKRIRG
jgi:hypothetical protein